MSKHSSSEEISTSGLPAEAEQWLEHLLHNRRYSPHTLAAYRRDLAKLVQLTNGKPLNQIVNGQIRQFLARLHAQGHGARSLARTLAGWRGFYQWWAPLAGLTSNPTADVKAPKASRGLPKALSVDQAQALLDAPVMRAMTDPLALRDQAMFELFYSSGLRLSELVSLDIHYCQHKNYTSLSWIDLVDHDVHVLGKGGKRRSVPVGAQAVDALKRWLEVRSLVLAANQSSEDVLALFLGSRGKRIHPRVVQSRLTRLATLAGLPTTIHPHVLRHSFASHVLQSAQDLRAVQEMLGHANISTTQLYTKLDFQHLSKVYDQAHPRAGRKS